MMDSRPAQQGLRFGLGRGVRLAVVGAFGLGGLLWGTVAHAWRMEADTVVTNNTATTPQWTFVPFQQSYTDPVVLVLGDNTSVDPSTARIGGITATGFYVANVEPQGEDGTSPPTTVRYMVIDAGTHTLPDGTVIDVGRWSLSNHIGRNEPGQAWVAQSFNTTFGTAPAVIADVQTINNETNLTGIPTNSPWQTSAPFLDIALDNITTSGVNNVALEMAETNAGAVTAAETVGYLAIAGNAVGSFVDSDGDTVILNGIRSPDNIRGHNNIGTGSCYFNTFPTINDANAIVVGNTNDRAGGDGMYMRHCGQTATTYGFHMDEDQAGDSDRAHTTEPAGLLAFSKPFVASFPEPTDVVLTKIATDTTPDEGQQFDYVITVSNNGPDIAENVSVTDILPPGLTFVGATATTGTVVP